MKRISLELTDELAEVLDALCAGQSRNAEIERMLWQMGSVKAKARSLKIRKPKRRGRGKPRFEKAETC